MLNASQTNIIKLAIPKGRMFEGVVTLLKDAGIQLKMGSRNYRPTPTLTDFEVKILKPQNIVEMLHYGSRDIGFAGADWVAELKANVVELLDTGLDPVTVVAAAPKDLLIDGGLPKNRSWVVASEYEHIAKEWIQQNGLDAILVRSYGATEVFPPEDANIIIDITATGKTLEENNLQSIASLMPSSTKLYANPNALNDSDHRKKIDEFVLVLASVMEARKRVMLEVNTDKDHLGAIIEILPCMRQPTVSVLHGETGFAVKSAVPKKDLPKLIPLIKNRGGTDIVVTQINQIIT